MKTPFPGVAYALRVITLLALLLPLATVHAQVTMSQDVPSQIHLYYDNGATYLFSTGPGGSAYNGLAYAANGDLYASSYNDRTVYKLTPGGYRTVFTTFGLGTFLQDVAFDSSGNLYVADGGTSVYKVTPDGNKSVFVTIPDTFNGGLIFDSTGNLFVSTMVLAGNEMNIYKVDVDGLLDTDPYATMTGSYAGEIAFDDLGNLYVSNFASTIYKVAAGGGSVTTFASGLSASWGLAYDSSTDLLYATDYGNGGPNGQLLVYDMDGTQTVLLTDLVTADYLALTAIPEPSTWALFGLGAAVFVISRRVRRNSKQSS